MKKVIMAIFVLSFSQFVNAVGNEGGGGGNSLGGRLVESYIKNLDELTEYQTLVIPLIEKVKARNKGLAAFLEYGFRNTIWYFVPRDLAELTFKDTGIPFSSDQIVFPNPVAGEIWVDIIKFNSLLDSKERAKLLSHEAFLFSFNSIIEKVRWLDRTGAERLEKVKMKTTRLISNFLFDEKNFALDVEIFNKELSKIIMTRGNGKDWDIPCMFRLSGSDSVDFCSSWLEQ